MNDFKKNNRFGGGKFGGGKFGGGRDNRGFGRPSFGGNRGGFGQGPELHKAICADCNKECEVPFRPNGRKPVYCKECFDRNEGKGSSGTFPQKEFATTVKPFANVNINVDALKAQIDGLHVKLDRLVQMLTDKDAKNSIIAPKAEVAPEKKVAKKAAKKSASKKK